MHTQMYTDVYTHRCTHTDTHIHRDTCTHRCIYIDKHIQVTHREIHAHADVHAHRDTCTEIHAHRCTHTDIRIDVHTQMSRARVFPCPVHTPSSVTSLSLMRLSLQRKLSCCVCVTQTQKHRVEAFCPCCDRLPGVGTACVPLRLPSRRSGSVLPQGEDGRMRVRGPRPWRSVWTPAWLRRRGQHEPPGRWRP